ncbi:MAG: BTAD domain-containing putative transcriptional regulator, partial [Lapillicoccus sp.]
MRVGILGPLEVIGPAGQVTVAGGRLRHLLLRLAVDCGRPVALRELTYAVWPEDPPADATNALQTLVSRLRRTLGDSSLVQQSVGGYRLALPPADLDAHRFRTMATRGRDELHTGQGDAARDTLAGALALWRGPALVDADGEEWAVATVAALEELRLDTVTLRIAADLAAGALTGLVGELDELCHAHPLREDLTALHLRALASAGRPAEALTAYERLRSTLADTLGTDPSPALQQVHLDLLRADAPAGSARGRRSTLRTGLTTFLGREAEQGRILSLLGSSRLVTVVGPGGAGKTRLASEVGAVWQSRAPDGVWLVELAPVTDPEGVVQAFLAALDLRETHLLDRSRDRLPVRDELELLVSSLATSRALLLVDNCEHLIEPTARVIDTLLGSCAGLRVLATSREPLGIDGEALCVLPPLGLPPTDAGIVEASGYAAVRLFVDRAASVRSGVELDDAGVADIVEIVRRLDGLPLAIELAAARTRILPVAEVRARLGDRFRLLTGGSRTAMPRHQTLRAVVEWSWDLLNPAERLLVERLSVFPAGATTRSASAICSGGPLADDDVATLLDSLVDKSLLSVRAESPAGGVRYRMLETIREFGTERLARRGEVADARRRHATWFASLVVELAPMLRGPRQLEALAVLEVERDNVLGALRYLADSGDAQAALELAVELSWYWSLLGNHAEATMWLDTAMEAPGEVDPVTRSLARATFLLNTVMGFGAVDSADAVASMRTASAELEELVGREGLPPHLHLLRAGMALFSGDDELADKVINDGLTDPDPWIRAAIRMFRVIIAENAGDVDQMREDVEIASAEFDGLGDRWGKASLLAVRGQLQTLDGELDAAIASFDLASRYMADLGARTDEALLSVRKAGLRVRLGDFAGAEQDIVAFSAEELGGFGPAFAAAMRGVIAYERGDADEMAALRPQLVAALEGSAVQAPLQDHLRALVLGIVALLDIELGDLDGAAKVLGEGHEATMAT